MLEEEWTRRAKLEGSVPRIMAARGTIAAGIGHPSDIEAVLDAFKTEGVRQDGELTVDHLGTRARQALRCGNHFASC